jgi:hypothetical protein
MSPAAVDESLGKLADLVSSFDSHGFATRESEEANAWRRAADASQWVAGVRSLVTVTGQVVAQLELGNPVVVTNREYGESVPQVVSLAQVFPFSFLIM